MKRTTFFFISGLFLSISSWVAAMPVLSISAQGGGAASQAELDFLASLSVGYVTETFDDNTYYTPGDQLSTVSSQAGVGSFTSVVAGSGGLCDSVGYTCNAGLAVLDSGATPFSGRFAVSGENWLDSMDAEEVSFSPAAGYTAMGFYITDPNDADGRISVGDGVFSFADIFNGERGNESIFYVTLIDNSGLGQVSIFSNNPNDGYGLDNITVGVVAVPEPGTLALLGLGLFGLLLAHKRKQEKSGSKRGN